MSDVTGAAVPVAELLEAVPLRDFLRSCEAFHGVGWWVVKPDGAPLRGGAIPPPDAMVALAAASGRNAGYHAVPIAGGQAFVLGGPFASDGSLAARIARSVGDTLEIILSAQRARVEEQRAHVARLAETHSQLADKNRRLHAAVERMQEVDRLKSNFLATISHELRTPLTSVIGYSEMLLEGLAGPLNGEQRDYVHTIMEKGDQLLQLITGLLDVSRIEAGTLKVARDPVDLAEIVVGAIAAMAPMARRKRLDLRVAPARAPRVVGDRDKIRQVLLNLIGNAIKFTPEGGRVEITLDVGALGRDDDGAAHEPRLGVRMRVTDSGIGIAPEKQGHIFEPFFQVDSSSTREYGGTGLGLALVKSYVEAHGGRVWVDSDLGRGSVFTVTLPAVEDELGDWLAPAARSSDRTAP